MYRFFLLTLALACSACADALLAGEEATQLTLVNRTPAPFLYLALEREASNLVDPMPSLRVAEHLERLVEPGQEVRIEPAGYTRGEDVRLFLYIVPVTDEGRTGEAPLVSIRTLTHEELNRSAYHVVVSSFR